MKESALSMANYFIELAASQNKPVTPLRLMKLVYIAHGYILAMLGRSVLNPRFDRVEAWKYGPVIPSVYHSFKIYGNRPIQAKTVIFIRESKDGVETSEPELEDTEAKIICDFVWKRYEHFSDWDLVELLHKDNTPWKLVYEEGKNKEIPDMYTKVYFQKLVNELKVSAANERAKRQ